MKSKLLLSVLSAASTFCATAGLSMAADGLTLSNPGFEDQLTGWEDQGDGGMSKVSAEAAHSGKFGLRVTDESDEAGSSVYSRKVPVTVGKTYQVQFWARNLSGTGIGVYLRFVGANGKMIIPVGEEEKTADRVPAVELDKNPTGWLSLSGKKTAPDGAVEMMIYIHSFSKHKVIADFDDFVLSEIGQ